MNTNQEMRVFPIIHYGLQQTAAVPQTPCLYSSNQKQRSSFLFGVFKHREPNNLESVLMPGAAFLVKTVRTCVCLSR